LAVKGTLFFNPSSGFRMPAPEVESFRTECADAGLEVIDVKPEVDIGATMHSQIERGRNLFVAAGGDGTINHVLQALVHTDAILGVIPVGTYNHFAKDLGIPLGWRDALEVATSGRTRQIDAGHINDRFFVNNISIGAYPELVSKREERGRDYSRWKARLYAAIATFQTYPHESFAVESANHREAIKTSLFMVSNNSYDLSRMGIEAGRNTLEEGRLSVYWLPEMPRLQLMKYAAHYLAGNVRTAPGFRSFRTSRMKIYSARKKMRAGVDGEVFEFDVPLVITIVPQSVLVKVPRQDPVKAVLNDQRSAVRV